MFNPHVKKNALHETKYYFMTFSFSISGEAIDKSVKYLLPTKNGKFLTKATYSKYEGNEHFSFDTIKNPQFTLKMSRNNIVIDLPPGKGSLKTSDTVLMPVEQPSAKCGPKNHDIYLDGTFLGTDDRTSLSLVKSVYTRTYTIVLNFIHSVCVYQIPCGYRTLQDGLMGVS